jgi:hypothetical protein
LKKVCLDNYHVYSSLYHKYYIKTEEWREIGFEYSFYLILSDGEETFSDSMEFTFVIDDRKPQVNDNSIISKII